VQLIHETKSFKKITVQLKQYFDRKLKTFDVELDYSGLSEFQKTVYEITREIPYGSVKSYSWLAHQMGNAGLRRAIGGALKNNPFPLIIPCHRVIRKNGSLGGFSGGIQWKRALLSLEGAQGELTI
jgi:methylated-DNA-[protein]-cysteine S-methyltransferase